MSDKAEMVSVPRELLVRLLAVYSSSPWPVWHELAQAIEAAPAEDVRAVVEEPVYQSRFHWNDIWLDVDKATFEARSTDPNTYVTRALFSHPQRPFVLPERREISTSGRVYLSDLDCEWNACLDEIERLNKC